LNAQQRQPNDHPGNVDNGIDGPHFVEVDVIHRALMHGRLGLSQTCEHGQSAFAHHHVKGAGTDQRLEIAQAAMLRVSLAHPYVKLRPAEPALLHLVDRKLVSLERKRGELRVQLIKADSG
jgi:hypothetical protein